MRLTLLKTHILFLMKKQKEAADNMTDEEIMTMIEALDEREINTLH